MALEQNEIKKVITVDLGNTTTSLKEYKKHIDELRGSLLQLDETSEEYQNIAKEIKSEQDKLNEVMKVGKNTTDAVEGSYNQLVQTMAELKKQWRATGDEAERISLGEKILEINNQLKELDASTGNYQRNVGDYANAFEQAFGKCLDGITKIDGPIGELGGTVKNLIPVIKSINSTALSGLSGIKKAIASTGIGLLVVGVGELAAHWEDVKKAVGNMVGIQDNYTKSVEESKKAMESLKNEIKSANDEIKNQSNFMAAQGATRMEILTNQLNSEKEILNNLNNEYSREINFYNLYNDAASKSQRQAAELAKERADEIQKQIDEQQKLINQTKENIKIQEATLETSAKNRIKIIEESLLSEKEKLTKQYNEDIELAKKYGLDTVAITEKYNKDIAELNKKAAKEKENAKKTDSQILLEQQKKEAEQILERVHKSTTDELTLVEEQYKKEKALLEQLGKDTTELTQEYEINRQKIIQNDENNRYKLIKKRLEDDAEQLKFEVELKIGNEIENEQQLAEAKFKIEQNLLDQKIAVQEQYIEEYKGNLEELMAAEEELDKLKLEKANNEKLYAKETSDYQKKKAEETKEAKINALQTTLTAAGQIFGALSQLSDEGSENSKNLAVMETIINTLTSIMGIWAGYSKFGPFGVAGAIAQTAAVTATGAATIAKIKSTNKNSGSSTIATPQMSELQMTQVNPLLDEQADLNRMNISGMQGDSQLNQEKNIRVYVVDQDIRDANHKAEIVENNAVF